MTGMLAAFKSRLEGMRAELEQACRAARGQPPAPAAVAAAPAQEAVAAPAYESAPPAEEAAPSYKAPVCEAPEESAPPNDAAPAVERATPSKAGGMFPPLV